ncbi:MAG: aminotransferase class V-fold PLP-dependent enzyme [Acidobacteria bacterium]|nr:aminotransferase class V-fold PLP-dependent enzyme [Acidobacteriota bacterium]
MSHSIYFDNAATSGWKPPAVIRAVTKNLRRPANPGRSGHSRALEAAGILYDTRETLGRFFNFPRTENIIFTKNATEALNIAIYGNLARHGGHVVTSSMEHNSVLRPLHHLQALGRIEVAIVRAGSDGMVTAESLRPALRPDTRLVVVTAASNVTGGVTDLPSIHALTAAAGIPLLVDAAQAGGAVPLDLTEVPCDMMAITGHKHLLGPQGTGALFVRHPEQLDHVLCGGTGSASEQTIQPDFAPDKFEAGTPNTPGLAGLSAGVGYLETVGFATRRAVETSLTRHLLAGLRPLEEVTVLAPDVPRLAVVSFNVRGLQPSAVATVLDREWGICCRPGLHCAPEAHRTLGTFPAGAVRFALSARNTPEEIDIALSAIKECIRRFRH